MAGKEEVLDLSYKLRGERLSQEAEWEILQNLNVEVQEQRAALFSEAWICKQQQLDLARVAIYSDPSYPPTKACGRARATAYALPVEGYKRLGASESLVGDFLGFLVRNPRIWTDILRHMENFEGSTLQDIVQTLYTSIYGCCILPLDEKSVLEVLHSLIEFQIVPSPNPRMLLRKGSCAFSRLYKLFSEGLYSAKLFLTASFHDPIMFVLSQDELFLDIDPGKAAVRFPPAERLRRFGREGTQAYRDQLERYRKIIVGKLVAMTAQFIDGLKQQMHCFPPCLAWLVRQLYELLLSKGDVSKSEAIMICTDLVFTLFVCPAITNPEPLGIIADVPISYIARFNLMQVGQILQVLAVIKHENVDPKLMDLYSQFDQDCMSNIIENLLSGDALSLNVLYSDFPGEVSVTRSAVLIRQIDLNKLLNFLKSIQGHKWGEVETANELSRLLQNVPDNFPLQNGHSGSPIPMSISPALSPDPSGAERRKKPGLKLSVSAKKGLLLNLEDAEEVSPHENGIRESLDPSLGEILIIPISDQDEVIGLASESQFIENLRKERQSRESGGGGTAGGGSEEQGGKRTRFSLTNDLESVATSDNMEAESSSNQSVCSSVDMETNPEVASMLADNLSDVLAMSANVSGRETPSISGRDTPSSMHAERPGLDGEGPNEEEDAQSSSGEPRASKAPLASIPVTVHKENRADIQEKFGKFEIPAAVGNARRDDAHSLISDSWSTDVVASDSEYAWAADNTQGNQGLPDIVPGGPDIPRLDLIAEEGQMMRAPSHVSNPMLEGLMEDRSETWSVDVLASDSEMEKGEDMDDIAGSEVSQPEPASVIESPSRENSPHTAMAPPLPEMKHIDAAPKIIRRQSSGSSFCSRSETDFDESGTGRSTSEKTPTVAAGSQGTSPGLMNRAYPKADNGTPVVLRGEPQQSESTRSPPSSEEGEPEHPMCRQSLGRLSFILGADEKGTASSQALTLAGTKSLPPGLQTAPGGKGSNNSSSMLQHRHTEPEMSGGDSRDSGDSKASGPGASPSAKLANLPTNFENVASERPNPVLKFSNAKSSTATVPSVSRRILAVDGDDGSDRRKQLLRGFRGGISNLKSKVKRSHTDQYLSDLSVGVNTLSFSTSNQEVSQLAQKESGGGECGDDILAKYRRPERNGSGGLSSPLKNHGLLMGENPTGGSNGTGKDGTGATEKPYFDPNNLTSCQAFQDAKRKLRVVLSAVDVKCLPMAYSDCDKTKDTDMAQFLKLLLAEALNSQDRSLSAQIRETLRSLALFDNKGVRKLLKALREEHRRRTAYLNYLQQSRLALLQTKSYLHKMQHRVEREQSLCAQCLVEVCTRLFLEQKEKELQRFLMEFAKMELQDEKTDLVNRFLGVLYRLMETSDMWLDASESQMSRAQLCIERSIFSQIYVQALYPNGDGDVSRDQVLHGHMKKLSQIITPTHKDLRIPQHYHAECPWPSAQAEISIINAYKTPRDKLSCVVRCCETIMFLLKMSQRRAVPAADDLVPVLVFVIIKANPGGLLSTIQYVNGFHGSRMEGEASYWWTQFCSAVEFIKTMEY